MSNKSEVERAAEVLRPWMLSYSVTAVSGAAAALSAAGLLRTDADKLNAELAEAMVAYASKHNDSHEDFALSYPCPERDRVRAALRAILDARKPKPRFRYFNASYCNKVFPWVVVDGPETSAEARAYFRTEPEARAYVAHLNAEGAK